MKKIFITIAISMLLTTIYAQRPQDEKERTSFNPKYYITASAMISTENGESYKEFKNNSCPTLGAGVYFDNISVGVSIGRGNFADFDTDRIQNYWYEANVTLSANNPKFDPYLIFGIGNYVDRNASFVEYGIGTSLKFKRVTIFVQTTNWDQNWYVTPGITYNL